MNASPILRLSRRDKRLRGHSEAGEDAVSDYRFPKVLPQIANNDELRQAYAEAFLAPCMRIGGYPTFTQEDPRFGGDGARLGDLTLLTVDTSDHIMWGDSGVAQFFMHEADAIARDFSKVVYNWDCL